MFVIKLVIAVIVLGVVAVAALAAYVFAVVSGPLQAEVQPPSAEEVAKAQVVEQRVQSEVADNSAFLLQLTSEDLTTLLRSRAGSVAPVRDVTATVNRGNVSISGNLNGAIAVPFAATVGVTLQKGVVQVSVDHVTMGPAPLPGAVRNELQPLIDEVINVNELLQSAGAVQIQRVELVPGQLTIAGIQEGGKVVSDDTVAALTAAYASGESRPPPALPGGDLVPPGRISNGPGDELYLALGDSLAANKGVSSPLEGYVSRFHAHLERQTGNELGLMNLGVSGESTLSIYKRQLPTALAEMDRLRNDGDPATRVSILTVDLGANDLLGHLASPVCRQDIRGDECTARLESAIPTFAENIADILTALSQRLEPGTEFYVMTIYNPFDFGIGIPFEEDSNEVITRMNDIIRAEAARVGAIVADAYTPMSGNAAAWTHMLNGDIHPTADGYQTLAYAFALARAEAK
ncbi:MAG: hypothetical protein HY532_01545 [Chloroflexi bacterium]|nr:hypothetical protein [Chloroflexota bacterium]